MSWEFYVREDPYLLIDPFMGRDMLDTALVAHPNDLTTGVVIPKPEPMAALFDEEEQSPFHRE